VKELTAEGAEGTKNGRGRNQENRFAEDLNVKNEN
jgi:hypothetical protein